VSAAWLAAVAWLAAGCASTKPLALPAGQPTQPHQAQQRLRLIIETDAPGGDPDDEGSLVRFFVYLDEWDIEGLLATRDAGKARTGVDGKRTLLKFIDAYEVSYANLKQHSATFPSPDRLRAITKASFGGHEARDHIIAAVDKDDPRPLWYANWGTDDENMTGMRQALDHVKNTRSNAEYRRFIGKIFFSRDADRSYHVREHIPHIPFWVDNRNPDRWYQRWGPLTLTAGGFDIERDVKTGHGPLGELYTIQKEGDTPAFMYLLDVGLGGPMFPTWGSWGGRFAARTDEWARFNPTRFFWSTATDTVDGVTSRDNTLSRWVVAIQNDFRSRMDWCVQARNNANHAPAPVLNGTSGRAHVALDTSAGARVRLSAQGSSDPDGHAIDYDWFYYREAGSYPGDVAIEIANARAATVVVPDDARSGQVLHVVVAVTDHGTPPLTRYRRAVMTIR
jgi:hypothetical protein